MREVFYHRSVPKEVREILEYYESISPFLADHFWMELSEAIEEARKYPEKYHFDSSGRRRCNLKRFPYHFLFRVFESYIRITVVRHHHRSSEYEAGRQ